MTDLDYNIVFEVEMLSDQYEVDPGGISIHLFQGTIPLDRQTELVWAAGDNEASNHRRSRRRRRRD